MIDFKISYLNYLRAVRGPSEGLQPLRDNFLCMMLSPASVISCPEGRSTREYTFWWEISLHDLIWCHWLFRGVIEKVFSRNVKEIPKNAHQVICPGPDWFKSATWFPPQSIRRQSAKLTGQQLSSINGCLIQLITLFSHGPIGIQPATTIWQRKTTKHHFTVFNGEIHRN